MSNLLVLGHNLYGLFRQHHNRHRRRITGARPRFQNAQVTTGALLEAWTNFREQLADNFLVTQTIKRQTAIRDAVLLRKRNQRLDDTAQFFCFG